MRGQRGAKRPGRTGKWSVRGWTAAAILCFVGAAHGASANSGSVGESWGDTWVNVTFTPPRPRAHEPMTIGIEVIAGSPAHPVDVGVVTPLLEREAAFSQIQRQPAPHALQPESGRPGHYSLVFTPPHSGLYRLTLAAPAVRAAQPARIEFPVWPQGRNPYRLIPVAAMLALVASSIAWIHRQQRAAR